MAAKQSAKVAVRDCGLLMNASGVVGAEDSQLAPFGKDFFETIN